MTDPSEPCEACPYCLGGSKEEGGTRVHHHDHEGHEWCIKLDTANALIADLRKRYDEMSINLDGAVQMTNQAIKERDQAREQLEEARKALHRLWEANNQQFEGPLNLKALLERLPKLVGALEEARRALSASNRENKEG